MLPTNVMSFMKKMVATDANTASAAEMDGGTTFGKLRQTLSSSLMTAQDKVTKMAPRPSIVPDSMLSPEPSEPSAPIAKTDATGRPPSRTGACRVCLKGFKPDDFSRTCSECNQRVCDDCASYSKLDANSDQSSWKCSVCRRRIQSRAAVLTQDSTDSLLDVPVLDTIQRRHSDVKLGGRDAGLGSGLAPPRSPELRRHSDVSPASLKELEKVLKGSASQNKISGDLDWGPRSRTRSPPRRVSEAKVEPLINNASILPPVQRGRRMSRAVIRQHSYDDEPKSSATEPSRVESDSPALGLPAPMPRRASAYDVYATGMLQMKASDDAPPPPRSLAIRRASFRALPPDEMPVKVEQVVENTQRLSMEEDRKTRRRGSHLPDIASLRALPSTPWSAAALEDMEAPKRQQSMDGEAIKIVIHDVDSVAVPASKRRVILRRDPADKAHRTRGFGMRVVGGKTGMDGRLFAYIVWTVPGGPAEKGGLQQGDKILEWGGVPLTNRSFEEVCAIMDHATGDTIELLVEHATSDFRMCDLIEEPSYTSIAAVPVPNNNLQRKSSDAMIGANLHIDTETDKTPSSPTRRKLPKTPEQIAREKQVTGRVQLQVWYNDERRELVVSVLAADDLVPRDCHTGYGSLPESYAKLRLIPSNIDQYTVQTEIAPASQNPIWNANLSFPGVSVDDILTERVIEVTLWDLLPQSEPIFLGQCTVDVQKAFLDDSAVWYRLEDPKQLRGAQISTRSPYASPRGSIGGLDVRGMQRRDFGAHRSISDSADSIGECASLLHPDYAWQIGGSSRRGSSQSEQLEVEVYQLGRDFSKSLPGSRRSSFQSGNQDGKAVVSCAIQEARSESDLAPEVAYHRQRRRSSCTKMLRDPDEILRSLKAVRGELGRTMSLNEKRRRSSAALSFRKDSVLEIPELSRMEKSPSEEDEERWIIGDDSSDSDVKLGPGQLQPRGLRLGRHGDIKIGLLMTKGQLEVDIISARNICREETSEMFPDTYIKCYLRDGDRWLHKRKTRVARHSREPQYQQTLRYQACDIMGRTLLVMLWERQKRFEHNQGLGGAEILLDSLNLTQPISVPGEHNWRCQYGGDSNIVDNRLTAPVVWFWY